MKPGPYPILSDLAERLEITPRRARKLGTKECWRILRMSPESRAFTLGQYKGKYSVNSMEAAPRPID